MVVQPGVEVERVEPNKPADSHDRDAVLMDQPPNVSDARVEHLGHGIDVEQPLATASLERRGGRGVRERVSVSSLDLQRVAETEARSARR